MTYLFDDAIRYDDSANLTAFNRLRVANSRILGDYRLAYPNAGQYELEYVTSNGASITLNFTSVCAVMSISSTSGSQAILQTKQYHPYIPGTGHLGIMTFVMTTGITGLVQAAGMFDDNNGIFLRQNGITTELVIRNNGIDTEVIPQNQWSHDRFDGSMNEYNPSGLTLDLTKPQIFMLDYQWLGVGRVRCGFNINGQVLIAHTFVHANVTGSGVYMNNPSLPVRWEIKNIGGGSASTMTSICASVYAEGADIETGYVRAISTDGNAVSITTSNSVYGRGILAVRLKNTINGKTLRALARLKAYAVSADADMQFKVAILPGSTVLSGSPSWTSVAGLGWCEYTQDFALNSSWTTLANIIDDQFVTGTTNNKLGTAVSANIENRNTTIYQNYNANDSQIIAIIGYYLNATITARATLRWLEVK